MHICIFTSQPVNCYAINFEWTEGNFDYKATKEEVRKRQGSTLNNKLAHKKLRDAIFLLVLINNMTSQL